MNLRIIFIGSYRIAYKSTGPLHCPLVLSLTEGLYVCLFVNGATHLLFLLECVFLAELEYILSRLNVRGTFRKTTKRTRREEEKLKDSPSPPPPPACYSFSRVHGTRQMSRILNHALSFLYLLLLLRYLWSREIRSETYIGDVCHMIRIHP